MSHIRESRTFSKKPTISGVKPRGRGYVAVATVSADADRPAATGARNGRAGVRRPARNDYDNTLGGTSSASVRARRGSGSSGSSKRPGKENGGAFGSVFGSKVDKKRDVTAKKKSTSTSLGTKRPTKLSAARFDKHKTSDVFGTKNKGKT